MKRKTKLTAVVTLCGCIGWGVAQAAAGPPRPATAEQIKEMIAAAGVSEDYGGADLVYLLDEADVYVQDSGLATTKRCQVIKVLTDGGVRSQSVLRWEFDPDTYRVTIVSVRVHRKDGSIEEVDLGLLITQPSKQHWIYWGGAQHIVPIPRLEIDDSLEVRTSKIGFNIAYLSEASGSGSGGSSGSAGEQPLVPPMPGHWYEVTLFQGPDPIVKKRYSVHMPKDMPIQYEVYNGELKSSLWYDGDYNVYTWEANDMTAVKSEPRMVALDDCVPKLVVATLESWEAKSRWFHDVNETQFDADDAIRAKVAEITAGLENEQEKIAACVHWVADNIRYYGTKRGPTEGFTLHRSIETFRDRGGVCKDKAGMAITMLRVLGHETYPALTMAGSRVEGIPADQFNHTVTVIRHKDGTFQILDPTWVPLNRDLWSSLEQLQGLVYGTPEGEDLTLSPYYEPEYNVRAVRSVGEIREDGALSTQITMNLDGAACNRFRRTIHTHPKPKQWAAVERALNIAPNARLEELDFIDPHDYSRDMEVNMKVTAERYSAGGNGVLMFRMPLMSHPLHGFFRPDFFEAGEPKERKYGMHLWATRLVRYDETLTLPRGWTVDQVPEARTLDSGSIALKFEATPGEGKLTYHFEIALKKGIVPAEDYPDYKKAIDMMNGLSDEWIVCKTHEGTDELAQHATLSTGSGEVKHD